MKEIHYYVYHILPDRRDVYYERTCGTEDGAKQRVKELQFRGDISWYQTYTYPNAFY